jgi:hypothetical protein
MEARGDEQLVDWFLTHTVGTFTLGVTAVVGAFAFTAVAGHSLTIGDIAEFDEGGHFFQATVTNVVVNAITIDTPFPFAFTADANCWEGIKNANVDGSAIEQSYTLYPPPGFIWDITGLTFYIEDNAAFTHDVFGGLVAPLTNGLLLRVFRLFEQHFEQIANIKNNADFFIQSAKTKYLGTMAAGEYGLVCVKLFGNEQNMGSVIRLDGDDFENIVVTVRDDLSTLVSLFIKAQGYSFTK